MHPIVCFRANTCRDAITITADEKRDLRTSLKSCHGTRRSLKPSSITDHHRIHWIESKPLFSTKSRNLKRHHACFPNAFPELAPSCLCPGSSESHIFLEPVVVVTPLTDAKPRRCSKRQGSNNPALLLLPNVSLETCSCTFFCPSLFPFVA